MLRVLHVEDEVAMVSLVRANLGERAEVDVAHTLAAARGRLSDPNATPYDLLLVDLILPDARDIEAVVALSVYQIPIVVLSSVDDPDVFTRAARAGADDYIVKPLEGRAAFVERLRFVRSRHQRQMCGATVGARIGESAFELLKPFITCDTRAPFAAA